MLPRVLSQNFYVAKSDLRATDTPGEIGVISGLNLAAEIARWITATVVASESADLCALVHVCWYQNTCLCQSRPLCGAGWCPKTYMPSLQVLLNRSMQGRIQRVLC